jgi:hypothetical protein
MTTNYTMKPMKLDARALMHPEFPTISTADFQAWLASPLTKALKKSQMEQYANDEALLKQALAAMEVVLSGGDFDHPYAELKQAAAAIEERLK